MPAAIPPAFGSGPAAALSWVAAEDLTSPHGSVSRGDVVVLNGTQVLMDNQKGLMRVWGQPLFIEAVDLSKLPEYKAALAHHDGRLLRATRDSKGDRHRPWRELARESSRVMQKDWPLPGPVTIPWCISFLDRRAEGAVSWDTRWRRDNNLKEDMWGVAVHRDLCKILDRLGLHDMCDLANLAAAEDIVRQLQLIEYLYYEASKLETHDGSKKGKGSSRGARADEAAIFAGRNRDFGECMVCPELLDHVAKELERDSSILKQLRKAREERAMAKKENP